MPIRIRDDKVEELKASLLKSHVLLKEVISITLVLGPLLPMHPHTPLSGFLQWLHHLWWTLCGKSQGRDQTTNRDEVKGSSGTQIAKFIFNSWNLSFQNGTSTNFQWRFIHVQFQNETTLWGCHLRYQSLPLSTSFPERSGVYPRAHLRSNKSLPLERLRPWIGYYDLVISTYTPFFIRTWQVQSEVNFPLVAGFLATFVADLPFKLELEASISCSWFLWFTVHLDFDLYYINNLMDR